MGEVSEKSFVIVKDYLIQNFPEFLNVCLKVCPEADKYYEESKIEQAGEGKLPRVFSHTVHEDNTVCYTEKMDTELSEEQRVGIFIHEFGHLYIENHPFDFISEEGTGEVENDDINADIVVYEMFKVEMHYNDNDIEYVNLPLGCDVIESLDEDDEESESEGNGEKDDEENGDILNDGEDEKTEDVLDNEGGGEVDEENIKGEEIENGKTNTENIEKEQETKLPEDKSDIDKNKEIEQA